MMKKKLIPYALGISMLWGTASAGASELIFDFVNPAFGGNPLNGSWLMSSAQVQNKLRDSSSTSSLLQRDPIKDFQESLNRQILYHLSRQIIQSAFGEEGLESGHYNVGDFMIDVSTGLDGIRLVITNPVDNSETIIEVPYY
ncbi:MAG: curli production assembly/transport component CsgF [bacterium]|jgi:curli production assembly/transport component CsgF